MACRRTTMRRLLGLNVAFLLGNLFPLKRQFNTHTHTYTETILLKKYLFYLHVHVFVCERSDSPGQNRASDALELELQMIVNYSIGAWN